MPAGHFKATLDSFDKAKRAVNTCKFYKSPTSGQHVNSSTPITFAWNNDCFTTMPKYVDIVLLSPAGQVFHWGDVDAASGSYQTELDASWWNNQNSVQLQLGITASDVPLFLSPFVAGPVFTALNSNPTSSSSGAHTTGSATATATGLSTGGYINVAKLNSKGLSRGRLAAAILLPILVAIFAIGGYVWFSRRREARRRAEWMDTVDKRMSAISTDWQSISHRDARSSMHTSRRNGGASVHSRSMSVLAGARASVATDSEMKNRATLYEQYSTQPFAAEDESQLGPRARALSAAAAEGRPLSSLINSEKDLPPMPNARARSKSTAADTAIAARTATSRSTYSRAPHSHTRTMSTNSNNPYASAMVQRDSVAMSEQAVPFPPSSGAIPRPRLDSQARSVDGFTRSRVISHVSFADAPRPSMDRRRNMDPEKYGMRMSGRENSTGDDYAIDFGDALPALALMRVKSGEGLDSVDSRTGDSTLTPTREFLPSSRRNDPFNSPSNAGMSGRTPDEMLKAYASAMANNEKDTTQQTSGIAGNALAAVKKLTGFWRK